MNYVFLIIKKRDTIRTYKRYHFVKIETYLYMFKYQSFKMNPHIDDKDTNQDEEIKKEDDNNYTYDIVSMYPTVINNENEIMYYDIDSKNINGSA